MTLKFCFETCFEHFSNEFSEYFPKNSSRKLHLEHTKDIIDGCRFGWVEIAFLDAIVSCCLNYDLNVGKRNFHQHIALVKSVRHAMIKDANPIENPTLAKYYNDANDVLLLNVLPGFESAQSVFDHIIGGKDNSRAEKKAKNLTQFFSIFAKLSVSTDGYIFANNKLPNLDDLSILLDKRPASRYLSALSLAVKNAIVKIPQLDIVNECNAFIIYSKKCRTAKAEGRDLATIPQSPTLIGFEGILWGTNTLVNRNRYDDMLLNISKGSYNYEGRDTAFCQVHDSENSFADESIINYAALLVAMSQNTNDQGLSATNESLPYKSRSSVGRDDLSESQSIDVPDHLRKVVVRKRRQSDPVQSDIYLKKIKVNALS